MKKGREIRNGKDSQQTEEINGTKEIEKSSQHKQKKIEKPTTSFTVCQHSSYKLPYLQPCTDGTCV